MCIIVAKPKGVEMPTNEIFRNCFMNNDDGAGLMYTNPSTGMIEIEKGFMTWHSFETRLDELKDKYNDFKDMNFVAHFRIGTQGKNDEYTCHPFPVSSKDKMLRKLKLTTDMGFVHNGILSDYSSSSYDYKTKTYIKKQSVLSDTQLFIKHQLNSYKSLNRNFLKNKQVRDFISRYASENSSKFAFIDKGDQLYLFGNFTVDEGVYYSNSTYSYSSYSRYLSSYDWSDWNNTETYKSPKKESENRVETIEKTDSFYEPYEGYTLEDIDGISDLIVLNTGDKMEFDSGYIYEVGDSNEDIWVYDKASEQLYFVYHGYLTFYEYGVAYRDNELID